MTPDTELPRDSKGIRIDVRGERDLVFNNWHRNILNNRCYVTDIDFLEYRIKKDEIILKAIFEVKEWHVTAPKYIENCSNFNAIKKVAEIVKIPFYFTWYKKDSENITLFKVWDVFKENKQNSKEMTPQEFKAFIESL